VAKKGQFPLLEAATKQLLIKNMAECEDPVRPTVIFEVFV
jgi:hypothetical protein